MPPLMGSAGAGSTGMDENAAGGSPAGAGGSDQARQMLEQAMGEIRTLGQSIDEMGGKYPSVAPEVKQLKQILKRMIVSRPRNRRRAARICRWAGKTRQHVIHPRTPRF